MNEQHEQEIIERWRRSARRAADEQVRVVQIDGRYRATSTSHPLGSYLLQHTPDGWTCECVANGEYGMPCKHLWKLAEELDLDVLRDIRVTWDPDNASLAAA